MTSEVFDENCNSIGFLGGITGNTKINGEDLSMFNKVCQKNKTNKFDIWKKRNLILKNLPKRL
jgi:hypothetical protein